MSGYWHDVELGYLIIIRGPTGVGKTAVAERLIQKLGKDRTYSLNLDEVRENVFQSYLREALNYEHVVGEMYFGNSHTTEPEKWITPFKERGFEILSVVLQASLEICFERINTPDRELRCPQLEDYRQRYYEPFGRLLEENIFAKKAVVHEILVNAENSQPEEIVENVLNSLREHIRRKSRESTTK